MALTRENFFNLNQIIKLDLQFALGEAADDSKKLALLKTILGKLKTQNYTLIGENVTDPLQTDDCFETTRSLFVDPTQLQGQLRIPQAQAEAAKVAILISLYLATQEELTELRQNNPSNNQEQAEENEIKQLAIAQFHHRLDQLIIMAPKNWLLRHGLVAERAAEWAINRRWALYGALFAVPAVTAVSILARKQWAGDQLTDADQRRWKEWEQQMFQWGRYIAHRLPLFLMALCTLRMALPAQEELIAVPATPDMLRQILIDHRSNAAAAQPAHTVHHRL